MRAVRRWAHDTPDERWAIARTWLGAVLISFSAVYVRVADIEAARSSFLRVAYALPLLALLLAVARSRSGDRGPVVLPLAILAGLFLGADLATWHVSVGIIGAGLGTVLPNLQVVFVGVAGVLLFRERPRIGFWLALPIILLGVWLIAVVGRPVGGGGSVTVGVLLGVCTAALYSGYLVLLRVARLRRPGVGVIEVMTSATFGAALATGAFALWRGVAAPVGSWPEDGWMLLYALGSQVVGWLLLASSIHRIPAALTSVALLLQPVLAMVWGWLLLGEPIGAPQWSGAGIALAGVVIAHRAVTATTAPDAVTSRGRNGGEMDITRTPDDRFVGLPGWDREPRYLDWDGLRLARVEDGPDDASTVVLLHGEPTWGYLYREVIPPIVVAGHRVVVPDLPGFGRSDKPTRREWYSYDRLYDAVDAHLGTPDLAEPFTLVVHDWGGALGLPWAVDHPDRVERLVILNTALYAPGGTPSEAWMAFRRFVEGAEELPVAFLVDGACATDLDDDVRAAYEAPFHDGAAHAGALQLPVLVPLEDSDPVAQRMWAANQALASWDRPTLIIWGEDDPILPVRIGRRWAETIPGCVGMRTVSGAKHFLQEDAGAEVGALIAAFASGTYTTS